ncbi:hypothetical protein [Desulfurobacterium sp.]|uniref:hypothetical protein n=1 Tax=Desulfurobacterium sp. TaxID=2004706 RepID=UPI0026045EDE|nr:hypothetical protein [Desulfurobacterium sp.]
MTKKSKIKTAIQVFSIILLVRDAMIFYKKNKKSIQTIYKAGKKLLQKKRT